MTDRRDWTPALSVGVDALNGQALREIAAAGIRELELSSGDMAQFFEQIDYPLRAGEISRLVRDNGLELTSIHLPFAPFDRIDPANESMREFVIATQAKLIRAAGAAGVRIAVIHPSGEPYEDAERAARLECATGTIGELAKIAGECGVTLALENLPRTCLGRTHDEMLMFLGAIPALRACFDMNHSLREENVGFIRALGGKIVTVHVSDYDLVDERHTLPGEGKNDWPGILAALEEVGYSGRFLYEVKHEYTYAQIGENYRALMGR